MCDEEMSQSSMMAIVSKESHETADKWLEETKCTNGPTVFQTLFFQQISKYALSCFQVTPRPVLKVSIKEEKCQEKILDVLEYFLCGEDPTTGFAKLQSQSNPPQLCGKMFKFGDPTFSCRDCGYDGTCVLCIDCFQRSIHKDHQYKMNTSIGSGFCDCGDAEAWKDGQYCELHQQGFDIAEDHQSPVEKLPTDMVYRAKMIFETILQHAVEMVCWDKTGQLPKTLELQESCNEDSFFTMLFNDEVHSYDDVINSLKGAIPGCNHEKALAYANIVDREGWSPVRVGNYLTCEGARKTIEKGTSTQGRSPLKCKVMHLKVVAHQLLALRLLGWINKVITYSEGLRRLLCETAVEPHQNGSLLDRVFQEDANLWKVARSNTHTVFMNSMIMDGEGKKWFAIHFTRNYKKLMDGFVADDHEHSISATSFSVQIFTVPTLARMLVLEHDVLVVILQTFMEELRKTQGENGTYLLHDPWFQPLKRVQYVLFDLKYTLQHKPDHWTDELREKFLHFFETFLIFLKNMQGMDMVTRKTGQHIENDPEWELAFTLQMRLMPLLSMVCEWCLSDEMVFRKAIQSTTETMIAAGKKYTEVKMKDIKVCNEQFKVIKYDVSRMPVTIHLPVSRLLAALLVGCHRYNIEISTFFFNECKDEKLKLFLMEQSLRTLVMAAQVHAGMWRRNGYAIMNQVFHYQNVKCRPEMYDKDIVMMQASATFLDNDHFLAIVLDKFGVLDWSLPSFNDSKIEGDKMTHKLTMAEEVLSLIITIVGERYTPGIGQVTSDDFFRREIIHKLCIKAMTHSELVKAIPLPDFGLDSEHSVDHVMASIATFKKPGVIGRGLYELKDEYYREYNPFFYHYSRIEQSKAEEAHRQRVKKNKNLEGCPPPLPPEFCGPFKNIIKLLCSQVLIRLLSTVLSRAASGSSSAVNHMHTHQSLHLIALALLEVKRYRDKGESDKFPFIQAATKIYSIHDGEESLIKRLECLHDNPHVREFSALIEWLLKTFHDELGCMEQTQSKRELWETSSKLDKSSNFEDEKARKARLAQERRAKIMAQMSNLQKAFIRQNASLLASMDSELSTEDDSMTSTDSESCTVVLGRHHGERDPKTTYSIEACILCQEQQEVSTKGRAVVMAAFVQCSTVLSKSRGKMFDNGENFDPLYPPADSYWGLYTTSCGHIMHSDCWQGYFDSVVAKERRALRIRHPITVDVNKKEFLCPLCGCICNTVLPILPPLALSKHQSSLEEVSLQEYLSSMQDVIMSNLPFLSANQEQDAKKESQNVHPSLAERFQALFHALTNAGAKFSPTLKDMMKVFAQACFTIGLGLEPNDDDKRVTVMTWTACAYTILSAESALRAEEKPLFAGITSRQSQCIGALTRLAAVVAGIADSNHVKTQCLRLLAPLTPDSIPDMESPCLLDLDIFSLMVKLRLSIPSLQYKKEVDGKPKRSSSPDVDFVIGLDSSSSMDMCCFQLCLAVQIVKTLLTTSSNLESESSELESDEQVTDEATKLASLFGKLRHWAGLPSSTPHLFPGKLLQSLKTVMLPFLRCCALFFHYLTEIPGPDTLTEPCSFDKEWDCLCHYLSLPPCLTDLLQWDQDSGHSNSSVITLAMKKWCTHEVVRKTLANAGVETLGYSIEPNYLVHLPRDYSELINKASLFTCPNSDGDESRAPVLCLICGKMLCSQSYCCQTEVSGDKVGACAAHAKFCGAGVGIFLRVRECQILLMANRSKGSFYNPPYLDTYGETDQGLRRGNPLYLCPERYNKLQKLWWSHSIAEEVAHCLEWNRNLLSIDWQIL